MAAVKISIATETSSALREEIEKLTPEHWAEFADNQDVPLDIDWDTYMRMHGNGRLLITTARRCGELVGYQLLMVTRHLHRDVVLISDAVTFIRPDIEARWLVLMRMLQHTVTDGRRRGATEFRFRVKTAHDYGRLLERIGGEPIEVTYLIPKRKQNVPVS